jgi:xylose isomerase
MNYFQDIPAIRYRYYKPTQKILGKTMEEHLRIAVCAWHTFCWEGPDMFGQPLFHRPWMKSPEEKVKALFAFIQKLNLKYFTFHDVDLAPQGVSLRKMTDLIGEEMARTGIELLWGTANLTGHPRYMAGAMTNPDPAVFAVAAMQVKEAIDATHRLKGHNYVLWNGRDGYETLLNTNLSREQEQYGRFLSLLVDYKHKIGFKGTLLIEPKPCEPMKHQYDFDCATTFAFLQKFGLEKEFKMNIESNHATLAGHTFSHEIAYAIAQGIFGSLDANDGDLLLGWDTDQFPMDLPEYTYALYLILQNGGFTTGGCNLDAKVRRQSIDLIDLFYGHVNGIDTLAKALLHAADLIQKGDLQAFVKNRYKEWDLGLGQDILKKKMTFEEIAAYAQTHRLDPKPHSGRREMLESFLFHAGQKE